MLIRRPPDISSSEITDERLWLRRRAFLQTIGVAAVGLAAGSVSVGAQPALRGVRRSSRTWSRGPSEPPSR